MHGFEFPELKTNSDDENKNESFTNSNMHNPFQEYDKEVLNEEQVSEEEPVNEEYVNQNPYSDTGTTNPFVDYDNMESIIEDDSDYYDDQEEYEEPEYEEESDYEEETTEPVDVYDTSFKTLYKEIKAEDEEKNKQKREKMKDLKLAFVVFMTIILAALIVLNAFLTKDGNKMVIDGKVTTEKPEPKENNENIRLIVNSVYDSGKTIDLKEFLEKNYSNVGIIVSLEEIVKNKIETLIKELEDKEYNSFNEFSSEYDKVSTFIDNINNTKYNDVSCLSKEEYIKYITELNTLNESAVIYYEGISSYNNNDYNNAYLSLSKVTEDNPFYLKSTAKIDSIYQNINEMIERDITNMTSDIEEKSEEEQKAIYRQIKLIIEKYGRAYSLVGLSDNSRYQELLEKYTNLSS